jgi:rubrerythrin
MELTHGQLRDFIRSIHDRPNGTGALLNLVRASEVRAAAELSCLADVILDDELRLDVTRHAADEARHAHLLVRRMGEIGFAPSRLPPAVDRTEAVIAQCRARDVKQVWNERGTFTNEEILELLVAAAIAERDAVPKLQANHDVLERDPHTQAVIGSILRDEHRHVEYLDGWVDRFEQRVSAEAVRATRARLEAAFDAANVVFYAGFEDYLRSAAARLAA